MAYGSRFVERDMHRMVEELEEERARTDAAGAGAETPLLQVHNLDFSYGSLQVLFDIDFEVRPRPRPSRCSAPTARASPRCCA